MTTLHIRRRWDGTPAPAAEHATLTLSLTEDTLLVAVEAPYVGDPAPQLPPGATPQLWDHEVVELFVQGEDGHYTEIELGPLGHHLVLRLRGVRDVVDQGHALEWCPVVAGGRVSGTAVVPRALLPPLPWRGNATAIRGTGPARRYDSAVRLPGAQPDFHQPDAWVSLDPGR